jgi:hypothetical protein
VHATKLRIEDTVVHIATGIHWVNVSLSIEHGLNVIELFLMGLHLLG